MFWEWIWWQIGAVENEKIVLNEATLEICYLSWDYYIRRCNMYGSTV